MDESVVKFRVGVVVIGTAFIAAILVLLFSGLPAVRGTYTVYMLFSQAPGVTVDTPVRKSGILIGRVTDVRFAEDGGVVVTSSIFSSVRLRTTEVPRITGSLLGDAVIQFVPSTEQRSAVFIQDGDTVVGSVASNPLQVLSNLEGDITQAINSVTLAGSEVGKLAQGLNGMLSNNDEQINRIVTKTERSLDAFQQALGSVNTVFGDEKMQANLRQSISALPELVRATRGAMDRIQGTTELANRNLRNLEGFTAPLGRRGEDLVGKVDRTIAQLDEALAQFSQFGKTLNRGEGTLGQLINNPDLYQRLNAAACNIEQLTIELKPIVRDARSFSDKIARHPELLGVRGAFRTSSGIK